MINSRGVPRVLEFNVRMGDPETQPILFRLDSDLLDLLEAAVDGQLDRVQTHWNPQPSLGGVMAAGGYPRAIRKGGVIRGMEADLGMANGFPVGTELRADGAWSTRGRRVLGGGAQWGAGRRAQAEGDAAG